jgi:LPS-assembly lipoprotein
MSSSRRDTLRLLALAPGLAGLAACGFRPLHAGSEGEAVDRELAAINVETPRDRTGQLIKNMLLDDLNPRGVTADSRYDLYVKLSRSRGALIIQQRDDITRYDLTIAAFFELRQQENGDVLYRSAGRRVASYNVRRAPFATEMSELNAEERAVRELSHLIRTQLALFFAGRAT